MPSSPDASDLICRGLSAGAGGAMLGGTIVPALGGPVAVGIVAGLVLGLVWAWWSADRERPGGDPEAAPIDLDAASGRRPSD